MNPHTTTLAEAQQWLREHVEQGANCPCCTQKAKIYKRLLNATMARALIKLYRATRPNFDFAHGPSLPGDTHEISQLVWWGFIEEESVRRPDGGRAGWWRITDEGVRFVLDQSRVWSHARVYDHVCLGMTGKPVGIRDCLKSPFDYDELMSQ